MSSAASVHRIVSMTGELLTYQSLISNTRSATTLERTATYTNYVVSGYLRLFLDSQITHLIRQGDRQLLLPAHNIAFVPKTNDRVTDSSGKTYNVVSVDERRGFSGEMSLYRIQVRQDDGNP